jgi:hypothetical protein
MKIFLNREECKILGWLINISLPKMNMTIAETCDGMIDKLRANIEKTIENEPWIKVLENLQKDLYKKMESY